MNEENLGNPNYTPIQAFTQNAPIVVDTYRKGEVGRSGMPVFGGMSFGGSTAAGSSGGGGGTTTGGDEGKQNINGMPFILFNVCVNGQARQYYIMARQA